MPVLAIGLGGGSRHDVYPLPVRGVVRGVGGAVPCTCFSPVVFLAGCRGRVWGETVDRAIVILLELLGQ